MISEKDPIMEPVCRLRLENEVTIYQAAELKQMLLTALKHSHPQALEIDLSAVTEIDSVGIQLLISAKKMTALEHRDLRLVGHSPAVIEAFDLLKIIGYFGDPLIIPPPSPFSSGRSSSN